MKILIVPSEFITNYRPRNYYIFKAFLKKIFLLGYGPSFDEIKSHFFFLEQYNYSYISKINGINNTCILGEYYPEYLNNEYSEYEKYPSAYNTPSCLHLNYKEIINNISQFDAIIIGIRSGVIGKKIAQLGIKKNILIAYIDYFDHPEVYIENNYKIKNFLTRDLKLSYDYNLYFKHDIPKYCEKEHLISICPMPVNPINYPNLKEINFDDKLYNICFSGRMHKEIQLERHKITQFLINKFSNVKFIETNVNQKQSLKDYCDMLNNSKIAFSPSGKVWDSTRHTELAVYKSVPLLPKPNCKLVDGFEVNDDNSINYAVLQNKNDLLIQNKEILYQKIELVIKNKKIFNDISNKWREDVFKYNTFEARSKYILNHIKLALKFI
jgi:hypothetical protein